MFFLIEKKNNKIMDIKSFRHLEIYSNFPSDKRLRVGSKGLEYISNNNKSSVINQVYY